MAIGKVYDSEEVDRLNEFISSKVTNLENEKKESSSKTRIVNYAILVVGAVAFLMTLKLLTNKK